MLLYVKSTCLINVDIAILYYRPKSNNLSNRSKQKYNWSEPMDRSAEPTVQPPNVLGLLAVGVETLMNTV